MSEIDRRELILARLAVILPTIPGIKTGFRNRIEIPENARPATVILDADETAEELVQDGRGKPGLVPPVIAVMSPEIYIMGVKVVPDGNLGTTLNTLRSQAIKAIANDQTLIQLCKDGDIRYLGFATGLANGRSMEGEAGISFEFRYLIQPSKL